MKMFRKSLSLLLAAIMVFSLVAVTAIAETTLLEITKQPTVNDPTVNVNASDVEYQWYVATSETIEGVLTDADVRPVNNDSPMADGVSSFDSTTGEWTPTSNAIMQFFWIQLSEGESITIRFSGEVSDFGLGNFKTLNAFWGVLNEDGTYTVTVEEDGEFIAMADYVDEIVTAVAYGKIRVYAPIESETSATLSAVEVGKEYYCEITRGDEVVKSDILVTEYTIIKQPTLADPSIEVSFSDEVDSYQWYKKGDTTFEGEIDGFQADPVSISYMLELLDVPAGINYTVINENSYYDTSLGAWIPASIEIYGDICYFGFMTDLEAGETITVETSDNSVIDDCGLVDIKSYNFNAYVGELNEDGTYSITVDKTSTYALLFYPYSSAYVSVAFRAYGKISAYEPIEAETASTLSSVEYGKGYFCEVTYNDETVIYSNVLHANPEIITQPTSELPLVEVAFEDKVTSYQWYKVEIGEKTVTDKDAVPADYTIDEQGSLASYNSETEHWTPAYYDHWEVTEENVVEGRVYFDNSAPAWEKVYVYCFNSETNTDFEFVWPGVEMTNIEGTDIWYYDVPDEYNAVIFNDSANTQTRDLFINSDFTDEQNCYNISSDSFSLYKEEIDITIYEFDLFSISLNMGETLTIVPGEELYYGEMCIGGWVTANENGEYVYYAEEDVQVYVYAQDDGDMDVTFRATVSNTYVNIAVEGATGSVFVPEEAGEYLCVITYEDGATLISDSVELDPKDVNVIRGDVNGDGVIDMFDYLIVKSIYFEKYVPTAIEAYRADMNEDNVIDMFDYLLVKSTYFNS